MELCATYLAGSTNICAWPPRRKAKQKPQGKRMRPVQKNPPFPARNATPCKKKCPRLSDASTGVGKTCKRSTKSSPPTTKATTRGWEKLRPNCARSKARSRNWKTAGWKSPINCHERETLLSSWSVSPASLVAAHLLIAVTQIDSHGFAINLSASFGRDFSGRGFRQPRGEGVKAVLARRDVQGFCGEIRMQHHVHVRIAVICEKTGHEDLRCGAAHAGLQGHIQLRIRGVDPGRDRRRSKRVGQ